MIFQNSETITYNENSAPITLKRWGQSLQDGNHMKLNTMIADHLGNTRVVLSQTNYDGQHQVEQRANYYAFGGLLTDGSIGADVQTHKYNGTWDLGTI